MNGSPELLEFYLVEATEYVDALDQLVASPASSPDANALLATARALRGSSTMAKVEPISELSLVVEQIAIRSRDFELPWNADLYRSLRGCVDDLRLLVRGVRVWSDREQTRADARLADLRQYLPNETRRPTPPTAEATTPVFVALQAAAIASGLDAFLESPVERRGLDDAVSRARTLRGVAGISEFPPLSDVADAVERAARRLMPDAPLATEERELFQAASAILHLAAEQLRNAGRFEPPVEESARLARAVSALEAPTAPAPPVIRIDQLFFADGGPHLVQRSSTAPMSAEERLHRELLPRAEHLQRLVEEARKATDPMARRRSAGALHDTVREMEATAASFGAHQVAAFFADTGPDEQVLLPGELDALATGARLAAARFATFDELEQRIAVVQRNRRSTPVAPQPAAAPKPPEAPKPAAAPQPTVAPHPAVAPQPTVAAQPSVAAPAPKPRATPTGRALQELLATGLAGLSTLEREPLMEPAPVEDEAVVPIDELLYAGDAALLRAIELRDALRDGAAAPDDALPELFDLLDLARSR